jgi:transposase InsO family protein
MTRDEIRDLLQRYREIYIHEDTVLVHMLHWKRAGAVWAIDFTEPPAPVDGIYPYIFTVRDLASKSTLLSLPVKDKSARNVRDALEALFKAYGAPLVLRSDNDKSFLEWEVQMLLTQNGTLHLLTPPYTPEYNGEVEAGAGSLKIHAHYEAARRGRPGEWICDDVEAARLRANEVTRPWGHRGPGPEKVWKSRKRISRKLRAEFLKTAWACKKQVRKELRQQSGEENGRVNEATVSRRAICRALVAHGLLEIRRRGDTLPILAKKCANI